MPKCSFCQKSYEFPRGLTYVLIEGTVLHFCSSKCRKNFELGRKSKKVKWVKKMKHAREDVIAEIKEEASESKRTGLASENEIKAEKKVVDTDKEEKKDKKEDAVKK